MIMGGCGLLNAKAVKRIRSFNARRVDLEMLLLDINYELADARKPERLVIYFSRFSKIYRIAPKTEVEVAQIEERDPYSKNIRLVLSRGVDY